MREDIENRIDRYFREGLDDLHVIPPADVWENIAEKLPDKKRNRKLFIWIAVAASVSLFAAVTGWNYLNRSNMAPVSDNQTIIAHSPSQDTSAENNTMQKQTSDNSTFARNETLNNSGKALQNGNATAGKQNTFSNNANNGSLSKVYNAPNAENNAESSFAAVSQDSRQEASSTESSNPDVAPHQLSESKITPATGNAGTFSGRIAALSLKPIETPAIYGKVEIPADQITAPVPVYEPLYAQNDITEEKVKTNRWAIGTQMAPLYSYRNISEVNSPMLSKSSMDQSEKAVITYASGIKVDFEASSRLTFQTGVYYMKMGQEIDNITNINPTTKSGAVSNQYSIADQNVAKSNTTLGYTNSTGTIVAPSPELYLSTATMGWAEYTPGNLAFRPANGTLKDIEQSFEFIEIPFLAKYKLINRKVNLHLLGGVSTHVLVNSKIKMVSENSTDYGTTRDVETMNYSSSVGFGVVYHIRKNLMLSVEPTFKYYLNSFNSSDLVKLHPYALGLYSGLSVKF